MHKDQKLTTETARQLKEDLASGEYVQKQLAKKYGISRQTVSEVKNGSAWRQA